MPNKNPKPDAAGPAPPDTERRPNHDAAWKQFFELPIAFQHLMEGFFSQVAALLDLGMARPISAEWARKGKRRLADAAWRVPYKDGSNRTLDVVIEFQSTVDADMAPRMAELDTMAYARRRAAKDLAPDGLMRQLDIVIHAGAKRWRAPGSADPAVTTTDEVALGDGDYALLCARAALDARRAKPQHPSPRNVIWTLIALCGAESERDIEEPLRELAAWLPELGPAGAALPEALASWLAGTAPVKFGREETRRLVARLLRNEDKKEDGKVSLIALDERWREDLRRSRQEGIERGIERGIEQGQRDLLRRLAARKFSAIATARLAGYLAQSADPARLAQASDWIIECATDDDLVARIGNGQPVNGNPRA